MDTYIAHKIKETNQIQTVEEHCRGVADIMLEKCPLEELKPIAWLTGLLHDRGKNSDEFQNYIINAVEGTAKVHRGDVNHSSAGGRIIEEMMPKSLASKMIQAAVYSHHGLRDCLSPLNGRLLFEWPEDKADIKQAVDRYFRTCDRQALETWCSHAADSANRIKKKIMEFDQSSATHSLYGSRDFFLGMYERLLLSLLVEADRTDTAAFMQGKERENTPGQEKIRHLWETCSSNLEKHLQKLEAGTKVDKARKAISLQCLRAAAQPYSLYRLTVPTGGGKTYSSLRFALNHARRFNKRHIIYVAPYNSILEQNAQDIKDALGNQEVVLEHHSNVVCGDGEEEERYALLTDNWETPIICTTAVQFLNTLFSSGIRNIRRMYSICSSVILFDEIQALPVRMTALFNQAINFLTTFGKSTVVLCSATQPLLHRLEENRLCPPINMIPDQLSEENAETFKRTTLIDCTDQSGAGFDVAGLCDFAGEVFAQEGQILIIVNTKECARNTYRNLKERYKDSVAVVHLSTNMCARNRHDILHKIKQALSREQRIICVSTQLIEAGVNLSFGAVIRSLAGLDSIIQAAGRCNRHGKAPNGNVYIVKMNSEAENISRLTDIKEAQAATEEVLYQYRKNPGYMGNSLVSEKAMELYYERYFYQRKHELNYNVNVEGAGTRDEGANLVNLLSTNQIGKNVYQKNNGKPLSNRLLNQAFKTAGDLFEVISENGKTDVIVEYYEEARRILDKLSNPYLTVTEHKHFFRQLQRYTVGISETMKRNMGNAVSLHCGGDVLVLSRDYYNEETGVCDTPCSMREMIF